jgi:hypothetical protein
MLGRYLGLKFRCHGNPLIGTHTIPFIPLHFQPELIPKGRISHDVISALGLNPGRTEHHVFPWRRALSLVERLQCRPLDFMRERELEIVVLDLDLYSDFLLFKWKKERRGLAY